MGDNLVPPLSPVGESAPLQPGASGSALSGRSGAAEPVASVNGGRQEVVAVTEGLLFNAYAEFAVDPETNRVQVKIIDPSTQQVIREIPSEEVSRVARYVREYSAALARLRNATKLGTD